MDDNKHPVTQNVCILSSAEAYAELQNGEKQQPCSKCVAVAGSAGNPLKTETVVESAAEGASSETKSVENV